MTISNAGEVATLDEIFNAGSGTFPAADPYISLHSAVPGETGANEVVGGSYARQQVAFGAAGGSPTTLSNTGAITFSGMPAGDVVGWGVWDAVTVGVCYWTGLFSVVARVFTVNAADVTADRLGSPDHGFANDDRVVLEDIEDQTIPTDFSLTTVYWVTGTPNTDDFQLSTTQDGGAVSITDKGVGMARKVVVTTLQVGNQFTIQAGDLDIFID